MASGTMQRKPNFRVESVKLQASGSSASGEFNSDATAYTGYTPVAIVGYYEATDANVVFFNMRFNRGTNKINVGWRTIDGHAVANHTCYVDVLYKST